MSKRWSMALALIVACFAVAGTALKSPRVSRYAIVALERLARDELDAELHIDRLEVLLFPPGVEVLGAELTSANIDLAIERVELRVQPWPSAHGDWVATRLEIDRPRGRIALTSQAPPAEGRATTPGEQPWPDIDIRRLQILTANLTIAREQSFEAEFKNTNVILAPAWRHRTLLLEIPQAEVRSGGAIYPLEGRLQVALQGPLSGLRGFAIERSPIAIHGTTVWLTGQWSREDDTGGALELALEADGDLSPWSGPLGLAVGGHVALRAGARGSLHEPFDVVRFTARARELRVADRSFATFDMEAVYADERLAVESLQVVDASAGTVTGSGSVLLEAPYPLTLHARVTQASLPHILEKAGLPDSWVQLTANVEARGHGQVQDFKLDLQVDATVDHFAAIDRSYKLPHAVSSLTLAATSLAGNVRVDAQRVMLRDMRIQRGSTVVHANGSIDYDARRGLTLQAKGERVTLLDVGPIGGVKFEGTGSVNATVKGPYDDIGIDGVAELAGLRILGYPIGDATATLAYRDLTLRLQTAHVRRGPGRIDGSATFRFTESKPTIEGAGELRDVSLPDVLTSVGVTDSFTRRLGGTVSGRVLVHGAFPLPEGAVSLRGRRIDLDGVDIGAVAFEGAFGERKMLAQGELEIRPRVGHLKAQAQIDRDDHVAIAVTSDRLSLAQLQPLFGSVVLTGELSGSAEFKGPTQQVEGSINVRANAFTMWGVGIGDLQVQGSAKAGELQFQGATTDKSVGVRGSLALSDKFPFTVEADVSSFSVDHAYSLPQGVKLDASGSLDAHGAILGTTTATLRAENARLNWHRIQLTNARPIVIHFRHDRFVVEDVAMAGTDLRLSARGSIDIGGGWDLRLIGAGDLATAAGPWPSVLSAKLPFDADVQIAGSMRNPQLQGQASIRSGQALLRELGQPLEGITAEFRLLGQRIEIRDAAARAPAGSLTFLGDIVLANNEPTRLDLRAKLERLTARPNASLATTASGSLSLLGPTSDLLLQGDLELHHLSYVKNIEVLDLLPKRTAPLAVPDFVPDRAIALEINVRAPGNLHLRANQIEAEFKATLRLTGTTERPGLLGNLSPIKASGSYRDMEFHLARGSVDFTEPFRVFARYDLAAAAHGCDLDMQLEIRGDSDTGPTILPTGRDETGPVDPLEVLNCLSYGVRLPQSPVAGVERRDDLGGALGGGLDLLWSVSGVDRRIKSILPYFDEVRLTSAYSTRVGRTVPRLVLSKELGKKIELRYSGALDAASDHTLSLQYAYSDRATLESTWASPQESRAGDVGLDLGLDLRLHFELE